MNISYQTESLSDSRRHILEKYFSSSVNRCIWALCLKSNLKNKFNLSKWHNMVLLHWLPEPKEQSKMSKRIGSPLWTVFYRWLTVYTPVVTRHDVGLILFQWLTYLSDITIQNLFCLKKFYIVTGFTCL